jgi:hypothetical protein
MQITENFTQLDGTANKATIRARKSGRGFVCVLKIGAISKTISSPFVDANDALTFGLRALLNYKENAII